MDFAGSLIAKYYYIKPSKAFYQLGRSIVLVAAQMKENFNSVSCVLITDYMHLVN